MRRATLILAKETGWQPSEIDAFSAEDFVNYLIELKNLLAEQNR